MSEDLKKIKEEREWIIQQMHEAVNAFAGFFVGTFVQKVTRKYRKGKSYTF